MKAFLVIPTLASGGAERVMSLLANDWANNKAVDVHLVLLAAAEDFYAIDPKVTLHRLGFATNQGVVRKALGVMKVFFLLRALVSKEKPDVLLSFMNKYNIISLLACFKKQCKVFVSERDSSSVVQSWLTSWLRKLTYPMAAGIIAQTENYKQFIVKETGNENVCVIPNPVRPISAASAGDKEPIILNVGRLVGEKGQVYLLEAFARLKAAAHWRLVILGDGYLRDSLRSRAKDLGISDRVDFQGAVKNVDEWLNKSAIFAFPSISEGFPNALAEAMAAGMPCVSFDCIAGPRDLIVDAVNGFLVGQEDVDQLAERLDLLIADEALRKSIAKEAKGVSETLSAEKICSRYLTFVTMK